MHAYPYEYIPQSNPVTCDAAPPTTIVFSVYDDV